MAVKSKSGGTKSARKSAPVETEDEEDEGTATVSGIERVFNRENLLPNWTAFSEYVVEHGGPKIKPEHVGIVLTGYKYFQRSDAAVTAREEAAAQREAAKEEREAAREQKARERAERAAEREEARAARATKKAGKTEKATPAKSSKTGATKKAAAAKKATPAKKKASRKAAF